MKNLYLSLLLFIVGFAAQAQDANLIIFSEEGERFYVYVNGVKKNIVADVNVKLEHLAPSGYQLKVVFEPDTIEPLKQNMMLSANEEVTLVVRRKKISNFQKRVKKDWNQLGKDINVTDESKDYNRSSYKYVLRLFARTELNHGGTAVGMIDSEGPGGQPHKDPMENDPVQKVGSTQGTNNASFSMNINANSTSNANVNTNTTSGSADVNANTQSETEQVGMNIKVADGKNNGSFSLNLSATSTSTSSQSSTDIATMPDPHQAPSQHEPVREVFVPGYSGPVGCPMPMSPSEFEEARASIQRKDFEEDKMTIAKQVTNNYCLTTDQVKSIMGLFTFEHNRLDFAKMAYAHTYDRGNYFKVNDQFEFSHTIDELDAFIQRQ